MLKILKVKVENFFSIKKAEFCLKNGVTLVYGENLDVVSEVKTSNGAGKTALFNAIYQGFFNKNLKDLQGTIASVNNLYTRKPYRIEIEFNKDNKNYLLVNDRNTNTISVYLGDELISPKGINETLRFVKELIGFDFKIFTTLTFLNQVVLENIINMSSSNNILYQFFELDRLKNLEKYIKEEVKVFKVERDNLLQQEQEYVNYLNIINETPTIDTNELENRILDLKNDLHSLRSSQDLEYITTLENSLLKEKEILQSKQNEYHSLKATYTTLNKQYEKFSKGICPVCGQEVAGSSASLHNEIKEIKEKLDDIIVQGKTQKSKVEKLEEELQALKTSFKTQEQSILNDIRECETKLASTLQNKEYFEKLKQNKAEYKEKLELLKEKLTNVGGYLLYFERLLKFIKSGEILEIYLNSYLKLLAKTLQYYLSKTIFKFDINLLLKKGTIVYTFTDGDVIKTFAQLSSGEKTRASLIILLANIKALEQLTNIDINFIIFDELLGVLDEEGVEFVKQAIEDFRQDKATFIITHHNEITDNYANHILEVTKENNLTQISFYENKDYK